MNQITNENLLKLLKDSIKEGRLLTNYNDYDLSLKDVIEFTKGIEPKCLLMNGDYENLEKIKKGLEEMGIDYSKRSNTLKCRKVGAEGEEWFKYDFIVEMTDEEFEQLCQIVNY